VTDGAAPADGRTSSDDVDALARAVGDELEPALRDDVDGPDESDTGRQRRRKDRRRASVPSWDEIMFGSKPQS
jgi:hypothetical protein